MGNTMNQNMNLSFGDEKMPQVIKIDIVKTVTVWFMVQTSPTFIFYCKKRLIGNLKYTQDYPTGQEI